MWTGRGDRAAAFAYSPIVEVDMARKLARERRAGGYRPERPAAASKPAKPGARGPAVRAPKNVDRKIDPFGAFSEWASEADERAFGRL
jgi:hypothetical protein